MITVTENAVKEVKRLLERQGREGAALRLGVKGGGCSGLSYTMNLETEVREKDQVFEVNGLRVIVDPRSFLYLNGMTLDFGTGLQDSGFQFVNPNAKRTCGCGESFAP